MQNGNSAQNYKQQLAARLTQAVERAYESAGFLNFLDNAGFKNFVETETGFYCDYAMPPINPALFAAIAKNMDALCSSSGSGQSLGQAADCAFACAFALESFSGAYDEEGEDGRVLQRIYVAAFKTAAEMDEYKRFTEEMRKRDHKVLGAELRLFSHSDEIGRGLTLLHPKGAMLRYLMESFAQAAHILNGYQWVYTPHIGRARLWRTSGHLDFYNESMYSPIAIDNEKYYLKPMNCPFHIEIYNSDTRSYRDLPIKYAEFGTVYRYELSGTLNGLTRVRGFTQDDAHIFCTPEQVGEECARALEFCLYILRSFGFDNFAAYVSTKPKRKFIGEQADWDAATEILKETVTSAGLEYMIDEGGGAFYGPKIDLKLRDSLNRQWQCGTIQFDFNLPERFGMSYIGADGARRAPLMVHRALFGSVERFMALVIEHFAGAFPLWLSPVQFGIVPIRDAHVAYGNALLAKLRDHGFRCEINARNENMRNKIKTYQLEKVPYILVVGDKEAGGGTFSVRGRDEGDLGAMDYAGLMEYIGPMMEKGRPRCILDD